MKITLKGEDKKLYDRMVKTATREEMFKLGYLQGRIDTLKGVKSFVEKDKLKK